MDSILAKYARLLVNYCLEIQAGERLYLRTTTLAQPLVKEVYREVIRQGGHVEVEFDFREKSRLFFCPCQRGAIALYLSGLPEGHGGI